MQKLVDQIKVINLQQFVLPEAEDPLVGDGGLHGVEGRGEDGAGAGAGRVPGAGGEAAELEAGQLGLGAQQQRGHGHRGEVQGVALDGKCGITQVL